MTIIHAGIAIAVVLLLIIWLEVEPVIALVVGSLYLGLAAGLGPVATVEAIATGFGDIMAEVGLLIGFGVLIGALLQETGALQRLVALLVRGLGASRLPYAISAALSTLFPSIYVDVQLVLAAPLARSAAPRLGPHGLPLLGGALTSGILVGYVFVVPGLGTISIAGLLGIPLGTMLLFGLLVGPLTAVGTTAVWSLLVRRGFWNAAADERPVAVGVADTGAAAGPDGAGTGDQGTGAGAGGTATGTGGEGVRTDAGGAQGGTDAGGAQGGTDAGGAQGGTDAGGAQGGTDAGGADVATSAGGARLPGLGVALLPVLVPLLLIAGGAVAEAAGAGSELTGFLGDPVFALFVGLVGAYLLARRFLGRDTTADAVGRGLGTTGQILLITGIGGSLGAVIGETDLDRSLASLFSASSGLPVVGTVLLAWLIAAVLHFAIGSISVAAIAAAGILAPVLPGLGVEPVVVGLAIGAGALFALQVNSNFFWMFQSLLGVTTRGALKALTFVTALASVLALPLIVALGLVL